MKTLDFLPSAHLLRILALLLLAAFPAAAQAQDFTYTISNGQITITGYTGPGGAVIIPDAIDGRPVTIIANDAFANRLNLTSVAIGSSVAIIRERAFKRCVNLVAATIGNSVTSIEGEAFTECTSLTSVTIGNNLRTIGGSMFRGCVSLATVIFGNSVTTIGSSAFAGCTGLTSVAIPNSVNAIGVYAFSGCTSLASVTIGNSVNALGGYAFSGCTSLTSVTIGNSLRNTGGGVFRGCVSLTTVIFGNSVTNIQDQAFYGCTSLTNITIPNNVSTIGNHTFADCTNLTSVTIPNSVTSIGANAFEGCTSLSAITVDALNTIYSSVEGVLFNKSQTTLVIYPGGKIGSYTIPNSVTSIGEGAFRYCASLTGVYFEGMPPSADSSVFLNANGTTVYYTPGIEGWSSTFADRPAVLWNPQALTTDPNFGVRDGTFGFTITGTPDIIVVVEASSDLNNSDWINLGTQTLANGSVYFSDPDWRNHPARTYRFRSP